MQGTYPLSGIKNKLRTEPTTIRAQFINTLIVYKSMKFEWIRRLLVPKKRQSVATCLILFILLHSTSVFSQITVNVTNQSIRNVLKVIENASDYKFFFNNDLADLDKNISLSITDASVKTALDEILKGTNIAYRENENNLIVLTVKPAIQPDRQQEQQKKSIKGVVTDDLGEPVIGANVVVKGTTNGTITDFDGEFSLEVPDEGILKISYIGYLDKEVSLANTTVFSITLTEDTQRLDEVVVVGYGSQKK